MLSTDPLLNILRDIVQLRARQADKKMEVVDYKKMTIYNKFNGFLKNFNKNPDKLFFRVCKFFESLDIFTKNELDNDFDKRDENKNAIIIGKPCENSVENNLNMSPEEIKKIYENLYNIEQIQLDDQEEVDKMNENADNEFKRMISNKFYIVEDEKDPNDNIEISNDVKGEEKDREEKNKEEKNKEEKEKENADVNKPDDDIVNIHLSPQRKFIVEDIKSDEKCSFRSSLNEHHSSIGYNGINKDFDARDSFNQTYGKDFNPFDPHNFSAPPYVA